MPSLHNHALPAWLMYTCICNHNTIPHILKIMEVCLCYKPKNVWYIYVIYALTLWSQWPHMQCLDHVNLAISSEQHCPENKQDFFYWLFSGNVESAFRNISTSLGIELFGSLRGPKRLFLFPLYHSSIWSSTLTLKQTAATEGKLLLKCILSRDGPVRSIKVKQG